MRFRVLISLMSWLWWVDISIRDTQEPEQLITLQGRAVALEAVRILKAVGVQPRRTIRIALWSGEEQGLLGSRRMWITILEHSQIRNPITKNYRHITSTTPVQEVSGELLFK